MKYQILWNHQFAQSNQKKVRKKDFDDNLADAAKLSNLNNAIDADEKKEIDEEKKAEKKKWD